MDVHVNDLKYCLSFYPSLSATSRVVRNGVVSAS
jgi:hypothetical protein